MGTVPEGAVPIFITGEAIRATEQNHLYSEEYYYRCLLYDKLPHLTVLPIYGLFRDMVRGEYNCSGRASNY